MQKHTSLPFKMKYLEPLKGYTSTGSTWFSASSMEETPTKRHASTETHTELSNIELAGFLVRGLPDCGKGVPQDASLPTAYIEYIEPSFGMTILTGAPLLLAARSEAGATKRPTDFAPKATC